MPVISVTRLHVRAWRHLPQVLAATLGSAMQARGAPGCLAVAVLSESLRTYWTRTAWQDEAAMLAYVKAGKHGRIMGRVMLWCDESSVVHWTEDVDELPTWQIAHRRLSEQGRHFPPPRAAAGPAPLSAPFPAPCARRWRELRVK